MSSSRLRAVICAMVCGTLFVGAAQAQTEWSFEFRAAVINPAGGDGTLTLASPSSGAGAHGVDFLDAIAPQIAVRAQLTEIAALDVSLALGSHDVELDVVNAGTFALGETDLALVELSGLFRVGQFGDSTVQIGPTLALASFDDLSIAPAGAAQGVTATTLDSDLMFGFTARLDYQLSNPKWYFNAELGFLSGGPEFVVFATPGTGSVLAGATDADMDPINASVGFGYRFGN